MGPFLPGLLIADYQKHDTFPPMKCVPPSICAEWAADLWSSFDVDRFSFCKVMGGKRFVHFRSPWPWHLTFRPEICSPLVTLVMLMSPLLEASMAFLFRENWRRGTGGRSDGRAGSSRHVSTSGKTSSVKVWSFSEQSSSACRGRHLG